MTDINQYLCAFLGSAEAIVADGIRHARIDDPHRFNRLSSEFDGGKAMHRLVVDYQAKGRISIALVFIGTSGGEQKVVQLFETITQGPSFDAEKEH